MSSWADGYAQEWVRLRYSTHRPCRVATPSWEGRKATYEATTGCASGLISRIRIIMSWRVAVFSILGGSGARQPDSLGEKYR